MSRFTGKQGEGALKRLREQRKVEADTRNALTTPERRSKKIASKEEVTQGSTDA